jgi:hypothetical protein
MYLTYEHSVVPEQGSACAVAGELSHAQYGVGSST